MGTLVYRLDGGEPCEAEASQGTVLIGRGASCTIAIPDAAVSRIHAKLEKSGDEWWIRDASSQNGTQLNGQPVPPARRVAIGDRIDLVGDVAHEIEIVALPDAVEPHLSEPPTKTLAPLKSFVFVRASSTVRIETKSGARIEEAISPRSGLLLAALIEARNAEAALSSGDELALAKGQDKNAADKARERLREWWASLCEQYEELAAASPIISARAKKRPEIIFVVGDERRLAISAARFTVI